MRACLAHWRPVLSYSPPGEIDTIGVWCLWWRGRLFTGDSLRALSRDVWEGWRDERWIVG